MSSRPSLKCPADESLRPPQPDKQLHTYLATTEARLEEYRQRAEMKTRKWDNVKALTARKLVILKGQKKTMEDEVKMKQAQIRDLEKYVKQLGFDIARIKASESGSALEAWWPKRVLKTEQIQWSRKRAKAKVVLKIGKSNAEIVAKMEKAQKMKITIGNRYWVQAVA